jgi:hypothetical protein
MIFALTIPLFFSVFMLPARLLTTVLSREQFSNLAVQVASVGLIVVALAATIGLHVKMWRSAIPKADSKDTDVSK